MNTPDQAMPLSEEDQYAEFIAATKEQPAEPAQEQPAAEAPQTPQDDRPRDEHGRFAPRAESPQAPATEPFDGFSDLPPHVQDQFRGMLTAKERLQRERDDFRNRFSRVNNDFLQLQRSQQRTGNNGHGRQTQPAAGTGQQAQPGITQARAEVASMPAGAERDAASRKLDAWERYAKEFPDEAGGVQQLVAALREDILSQVAPQLQGMSELQAEVAAIRDTAERFRTNEQEQRNRACQASMDDLAPGWRIAAGWQDEQGNEIPRGERQWHPGFSAWLEGHDPEVRQFKLEQLSNGSPQVAAEVFRQFFADFEAVSGQTQQAPAPVANRRAEALRDVAPGSAGGKPATPVWREGMSDEDQWAAYVASTRTAR